MTDPGSAVASAALALVGSPFRLHGRNPETGIDCIGLVAAALVATGLPAVAPTGYGLRNHEIDQWLPLAARSGLGVAAGQTRPGDILLIALARGQHHLVIATDAQTVVHAHASLRRVVHQPLDPAWRIEFRWRVPGLSEG